VSFDNRCPDGLQYFQVRYISDDVYIQSLENEVIEFIKELDSKYNQLSEKLNQMKEAA
jgi:hypothetical protein